MNKKINISGFTFIELVVVITIIAILSVIGLISFEGYSGKARDSNRISQIQTIYKSLETYRLKGFLPKPEDFVNIYSSGVLIGYQGYAGENVLNNIGYKDTGKDPSDDKYFTYYTSKDLRNAQLVTFLENDPGENKQQITYKNFINQTNALEYTNRIPMPYGKKLGILIDSTNMPIQEISSIKISGLDISTTNNSYSSYFGYNNKITGTGNILRVIQGTTLAGGILTDCKDYITKNNLLYGNDGNYIINPDGKGFFEAYCDMTTEGGGWTKVTQATSTGGYTYAIKKINVDQINEMFFSYNRADDFTKNYAYKFLKHWTKQCGIEHGSTTSISDATKDFVGHVLQTKPWGVCDRISTTDDANDIEIQKIIGGKYVDDSCINGNLKKVDSRNYSWTSATYLGRPLGIMIYRISNSTVLFGPRGDGSARCAGSTITTKSATNISLFVR